MHLLNVETSIVPQIEDTIREPTISSERIIHEVSLITSHQLISMLLIQQMETHPSPRKGKHKLTDITQHEVKKLEDDEKAPKIPSES